MSDVYEAVGRDVRCPGFGVVLIAEDDGGLGGVFPCRNVVSGCCVSCSPNSICKVQCNVKVSNC